MRTTILTVLFSSACCLPGFAQHSDLEIEISGDQLKTDPRIAESEFGENPSEPNIADEPGFEVDDGVFTANQPLGFNVSATEISGVARNLWYWDGASPVQFGSAPHELVIQHPLVDEINVRIDSLPEALPKTGFQIAQADDEGGVHQDLEFVLVDADGMDVQPASGAYLFGLEMTSTGFDDADPSYFVVGTGIDEATHELAVDFVATTFAVPEPSASEYVGLGLFTLITWRRRRRRLPIGHLDR